MLDVTPVTLLEPAPDPREHLHTCALAFIAGFPSLQTRLAYQRDLRQWFAFCDDNGIDPLTVRRPHVDLFMRTQEGKGLAPNTRGRRLACLKSFYGWLVDEDVIPANPAARVKPPRKHEPELPSLNRHEMHRFLAAAEELGGYDYAAIALTGTCALRISEATGANIADIVTKEWTQVITVHGKGAKDRSFAVPPLTMGALARAWGDRTEGPMLLNRAGRRMTRGNFVDILERTKRLSGIDKHLTTHSMRRSAIQIALDAGVPLRDVQKWAGHSDPSTTLSYDRRPLTLDRSPSWAVMQATA